MKAFFLIFSSSLCIFMLSVEASFAQKEGRTTFNSEADFRGAIFDSLADFREAKFNNTADFREAIFISEADFRWATFNSEADFTPTRRSADN